jgi:hypothetical protein
MNAAQRYIYEIKNSEKKAYAWAYYNYRTSSRPEPVRAEYKLSVMAAQAVRQNIVCLLHQERMDNA